MARLVGPGFRVVLSQVPHYCLATPNGWRVSGEQSELAGLCRARWTQLARRHRESSRVSPHRFSAQELRAIERIVEENRQRFLEAWHEFFGH